jgi:hypothetical protein
MPIEGLWCEHRSKDANDEVEAPILQMALSDKPERGIVRQTRANLRRVLVGGIQSLTVVPSQAIKGKVKAI